MTRAIAQLIGELKMGADMTEEGASGLLWREKVRRIPIAMQSAHPGRFIVASSARQLLLQRGQLKPQADVALCGVLRELAAILEIDLEAERASSPRETRAAQPYWNRD